MRQSVAIITHAYSILSEVYSYNIYLLFTALHRHIHIVQCLRRCINGWFVENVCALFGALEVLELTYLITYTLG